MPAAPPCGRTINHKPSVDVLGKVKVSFPNWLSYTLSCQPFFPLWLAGDAYEGKWAEPAQSVTKAISNGLRNS